MGRDRQDWLLNWQARCKMKAYRLHAHEASPGDGKIVKKVVHSRGGGVRIKSGTGVVVEGIERKERVQASLGRRSNTIS